MKFNLELALKRLIERFNPLVNCSETKVAGVEMQMTTLSRGPSGAVAAACEGSLAHTAQ